MGDGLSGGCAPDADDANVTMALDEANVKQTCCGIVAYDKLTILDFGMVGVRKDSR
jgi:hypothetical protein